MKKGKTKEEEKEEKRSAGKMNETGKVNEREREQRKEKECLSTIKEADEEKGKRNAKI